MFKAVWLILFPARAWEGLALQRRGILYVLAFQLLPLLLLSAVVDGYGLVHWGKWQNAVATRLKVFPMGEALVFEAALVLLSLALVFIASGFVRSFGSTFHGRHTYREAFATVVYGLSPLFLCRMFEIFRGVTPWVSWGLGILLTLGAIYHGVPRMMNPDPAHAFGLYVATSVLLFFMTGLIAVFAAFYLDGRFPDCEQAFLQVSQWLHF